MASQICNFGKNVCFTPAVYSEPRNERELLQLLSRYRDQSIRVVASRHAWSDGIKTDGLLISVHQINHVRVNQDRQTVMVGAGCQVKHLLPQLKRTGLTLPSVGLIDEQTIAGATATGTHGSGKHSLSHYIRGARVAHFDPGTGEPVITEIDAGDDLLAARCSLGLLGVIVELELELRPDYRVLEYAQRHDSLEQVLAAETEYPLQQFYLIPWSWQLFGQHRGETDLPRSRLAGLYRAYWHLGIDWGLHLLIFLMAKILRAGFLIRSFYRFILPLLIVRKWRVVDDSQKMLTMEHELFRHIEIEFFVKRSQLEASLDFVKYVMAAFGGQQPGSYLDVSLPAEFLGSYCHHYPVCIRRILCDDTLISATCAAATEDDEDWFAISLISYDWPGNREGFFSFARFLAATMPERFGARCHWGKFNPLSRETNEQLYPAIDQFRDVVRRFDRESRFANQWLREVLLGEPANPG